MSSWDAMVSAMLGYRELYREAADAVVQSRFKSV